MGFLRALWKVITYLPPVWVLVLQSVLIWQIEPAFGHSKAIVQCKGNIKYSKAVKVKPDAIVVGTGLYAEHYDTNDDGEFDVVTLSHTELGVNNHRSNPVFWIVDLDFDGTPDAIYIDKQGLGKCEDIVLYEDLNLAAGVEEDRNSIDKGRKL